MNLIDRYVHDVGRRLPRKKRADIEVELKSHLADSLDDRVDGEPTEEDEIELLKEFDPPAKVAASYREGSGYLISPDLYPFFRMVMGIVLLVLVIVQLVLLGVLLVFDPSYTFDVAWFFDFFGGLISAFGSVVLVFVVLQYFGVRPEMEEEPWDPRTLPEVVDEDPVSSNGLLVEITFGVVLIAVLLFLPDILGLLFARGLDVVVNPILQQNLPLVITALLLGVLLNVVLLWRGQWTTATRLVKIGVNIFVIGVFYLLIVEHTAWLTANGAGGLFTVFENFPENGDFSFETSQILVVWAFRLAFIVAFIVTIVDTVKLIYILLRNIFFPASLTLPVPVEDKE